jgi:hypothetical protein
VKIIITGGSMLYFGREFEKKIDKENGNRMPLVRKHSDEGGRGISKRISKRDKGGHLDLFRLA